MSAEFSRFSLFKRHNGLYSILYYHYGHRRWKATHVSTKSEALAVLSEFRELLSTRFPPVLWQDFMTRFLSYAESIYSHQEKRIRFTPCSLLVQELLIAKRDLKLARVLKRLARYDVILIDDIGYVQQNREEMEVLFTLLAERSERGSVMITSNLPSSQWERIFRAIRMFEGTKNVCSLSN